MSSSKATDGPMDGIILEPKLELPAARAIRRFRPWHLPRKHLVRKDQWSSRLEALFADLPDHQPICYLGLPGEDLLDLEVMAKVCKAADRSLKFLGFDDEDESTDPTPRQLAENIVRSAVTVLPGSCILRHRFAAIAESRSPAQLAFRDFGHFDVVNLDLCGAFSSQEPMGHMHNAIAELVRHQRNSRTTPWLLMLTLRGEPARMLPHEREAYLQLLIDNCRLSLDFSNDLCPVTGGAVRAVPLSDTQLRAAMGSDPWTVGRLTAVSIGKWLLHLTSDHTPWRVSILSVWGYRTGLTSDEGEKYASESPNMISAVYRFDRSPESVSDEVGLATSFRPKQSGFAHLSDTFERTQAEKMAKCVRHHSRDLDCHVQSNSHLASELLAESLSSLAVRSYDSAEYINFVKRSRTVTC